MAVWVPVKLPDIKGPIRGFTFPDGNEFFVFNPTGLIRVTLDPVKVETLGDVETVNQLYAAMDPTGKIDWCGKRYFVYDADQGDITESEHPNGERMEMDPAGPRPRL